MELSTSFGGASAGLRSINLPGCWANGSISKRIWGGQNAKGSFPPSAIFLLFLFQVLNCGVSCREALRKFLAWLAVEKGKTASFNTAAYCKARAKLRVKDLEKISLTVANKILDGETRDDLWIGRRVKVIDGSGLSMPDTPQNRKKWPQSARSAPGCGFPVMRIVAVFSLSSGALIAPAKGALFDHERTLFRRIWNSLQKGDVALADRGFCSLADFFLLKQKGVDSVMRKNQRRSVGVSIIKRLGKNDRLVWWHKTSARPDWLSEDQWEKLPEKIVVREIKIIVNVKGFRSETIEIATTLTDPVKYPARAFAELYLRRWQAELYLRDIKITMGMDILTCKSPQMIEKELWIHIIAYNLIRAVMQQAANTHRLSCECLSFKGTLSTVRQWAPVLSQFDMDENKRLELYKTMLFYIAYDTVPFRPNRSEPRAKKRRPKNYQLLNKPRKLFKEIPHRNKYKKP